MKNSLVRRELIRFGEQHNKAIWIKDELRTLFNKNTEASFDLGLSALVKDGSLVRIAKGVFYQPYHPHLTSSFLAGQAVKALRRKHYNYLSLESSLSDYGIISQVPFVLTFMTTGRSGLFETPVGRFEFTHTARSAKEILEGVYMHDDYWRATPQTALRDLRRVGRNLHLVDEEAAEEEIAEHLTFQDKLREEGILV